MKTSLITLFLVSLFSLSSYASSKTYYIGLSGIDLEDFKKSSFVEEVIKEFPFSRVIKIKTSFIKDIKKLRTVDYVEEAESAVVLDERSKFNSLDEIESDAEPVIYGDYPWGVERAKAPKVWANYNVYGEGVRVLVLDTGIQKTHPAISDRIIEARDFTDTKPNKYVPFAYHDIPGHGTHVATTIAGNGFNKLFGVAPNASLYIGKVCVYLCRIDAILGGLDWAIKEKFDVVNMSFSAPKLPINTIERMFKILEENNTLVVASAGNEGRTMGHSIAYPAAIKTVLAVGASDEDNKHSSFSSQGVEVSLLAPGKDILSASPVKGPERTDLLIKALSGTSMAAPHVSGAGALIKEKFPEMKVSEIRKVLKQSAVKSVESQTFPSFYGSGVLNLERAFHMLYNE